MPGSTGKTERLRCKTAIMAAKPDKYYYGFCFFKAELEDGLMSGLREIKNNTMHLSENLEGF